MYRLPLANSWFSFILFNPEKQQSKVNLFDESKSSSSVVFSQRSNRDHIFPAKKQLDKRGFDKPESINWTESMKSGLENPGCVQVSRALGCGTLSPILTSGDLCGEELSALPPLFPSSPPSLNLSQGQVNVGLCPTLGTCRGCLFGTLILPMSPQITFQSNVSQMCIWWGTGAHQPSIPSCSVPL